MQESKHQQERQEEQKQQPKLTKQKEQQQNEQAVLSEQEDRKLEEQHLEQCLTVVRSNIEKYAAEEAALGSEIKAMYEHYHDDNPEMYIELSNNITRKDNVSRALRKNWKALRKPYFGRIDYEDVELGKKNSLYLGKNSVAKNNITMEVVDWRAPVASVYYENETGNCKYQVPDGTTVPIQLERKRTYEIDRETLIDFYDSEVVANDELLTKYLAKNKEAVLGEIIATIQKEQNDIIRRSPYRSVVVQGVAGSGKTTVAMHRISYILYNFSERFRPSQFYIIGSNPMFLNYITGVLPDLDVDNVNQMTMDQFLRELLEDETFIDKCKTAKPLFSERAALFAEWKGSYRWIEMLEEFISEYERRELIRPDISFDGSVLISQESVEALLSRNKGWSTQEKRDYLNARVMNKLKNQLALHDREYEREEILAINKQFKGIFGSKKWKGSLLELYVEFLRWLGERFPEFSQELYQVQASVQKKQLELYDYASLVILKKRIKETEAIGYAEHVVVDEAQDYGAMVFAVLKTALPHCTFTVMGDVSQNINYYSGMNDWEILKKCVFNTEGDFFGVLAKSYRNTIEISEYASKILSNCSFPTYKTEPIIRHGEPVKLIRISNEKKEKENGKQTIILSKLIQNAERQIADWLQIGYDTIAVICRDDEECQIVRTALSKQLPIHSESLELTKFGKGVMVLPIHMTKGLEFDTVILWNPCDAAYPKNDANAKLLYVAATRALHELTVIYEGTLSELL